MNGNTITGVFEVFNVMNYEINLEKCFELLFDVYTCI